MIEESKICRRCGKQFHRHPKYRAAQWARAVFCGVACANCAKMAEWHIEARAMRESGAKTKDIAVALGKKHSTVRWVLAAYCGVKIKCPVDHNRGPRVWTADRKSEFTALWLAGVPTAEIARRFNLAYAANVSTLAATFKLPRRTRGGRHRNHVRWTADHHQQLRKLWLDNELSVQQIALRLGHTKSAISNRRWLLRLPPRYQGYLGAERISLAAWNRMSKEERQRIPEWRSPPSSYHVKTRRTPKRWGLVGTF